MATVNYTTYVENWITSEKKALIRDTNRLFSKKYLLEENDNFQEYVQECLCDLNKLRENYRGTLGYAMIRQLHCDEANNIKEEPNEMCRICNESVHAPNILSPNTIHEEDYEKYASIFTRHAIKAGRFKVPEEITEKLLHDRFMAIFTQNRFLKNTPKQNSFAVIKKAYVVELCFSLGWDSEKCDALLLRADLDPLWANSEEDAISKFLLDVKTATWSDIDSIQKALRKQKKAEKRPLILNPATHVAVETLESIIMDKTISTHEERLEKYVCCLYEYQHVFDHFSNRARNIFGQLLLMAVCNMGWKSSFMEKLPQNLLDCLARDDIPPLSEKQQERLIKAFYTGQSPTTADLFYAKEEDLCFKASYKSDLFSYPKHVGEGLYRVSLYDELLALLRAEAPIGKNHILYVLFLVTLTSRKYKKGEETRENFVQEFATFVENSNAILSSLHLPGFYAPSALEHSIGLAFLAGSSRQDTFEAVSSAFTLLTEKQEKRPKMGTVSEPVAREKPETETAAKPANMPGAFTYSLKRDLDSSMIHFSEDVVEKLKQASGTTPIYDSLEKIAAKITENWKVIGLLPTNVEFTRESIIFCPDGYTPVSLGKPDKTLTDLLFGEDSPKGEKLKAFWVPFEGKELTLYDLAAEYHEEGEVLLNTFLQNANLNLRYRQNCILRTIASLVMVNFKVKERPQIHTKKVESPYVKFPFVNEYDTQIKADRKHDRQMESAENDPKNNPENGKPQTEANQNPNTEAEGTKTVPLQEEIKTFSKTFIPDNASKESTNGAEKPEDDTEEPEDDTEETMADTIETEEDDVDAEDNAVDDAEDTEEMAEEDETAKNRVASGYAAFKIFAWDAMKAPNLSAIEETELINQFHKGDQKAKDNLIYSSQRILVYKAKEVYKNGAKAAGIEIMELVSEGFIALDKAIKNYDPNRISDDGKKASFSTYATTYIRLAMLDMVRKDSRGIKLPLNIKKEIRDMEKAEEKLSKELGRHPLLEEVAVFLNKSETELKNIYRNKETSTVVSYNSPMSEDGEGTFLDTFPDPSLVNPEDLMMQKALWDNLEVLSPRTASILRLHFGKNDEETTHTLTEISVMLGISLEETIRRELDGLRKIQQLEM